MRKLTINLMAVLAIWAIIVFCFGCKTRKVNLQTSTVHKETKDISKTAVSQSDSTVGTDNTVKQETTSTTLKQANQDSTELEADSIIITSKANGEKKVIIFPTRGKRLVHYSNSTFDQTIDNTVNTAYATSITKVSTLDSSVNKKSLTKSDSTGKTKVTDAVGSGSVWATAVPIVGGIVLIVIALLVWMRVRK